MVGRPDEARLRSGQAGGDRRGVVPRAIVDDDDLPGLREGRQGCERLLDEAPQIRLLVVGREEIREPGNPLRHLAAPVWIGWTRRTFRAMGDASGVRL